MSIGSLDYLYNPAGLLKTSQAKFERKSLCNFLDKCLLMGTLYPRSMMAAFFIRTIVISFTSLATTGTTSGIKFLKIYLFCITNYIGKFWSSWQKVFKFLPPKKEVYSVLHLQLLNRMTSSPKLSESLSVQVWFRTLS